MVRKGHGWDRAAGPHRKQTAPRRAPLPPKLPKARGGGECLHGASAIAIELLSFLAPSADRTTPPCRPPAALPLGVFCAPRSLQGRDEIPPMLPCRLLQRLRLHERCDQAERFWRRTVKSSASVLVDRDMVPAAALLQQQQDRFLFSLLFSSLLQKGCAQTWCQSTSRGPAETAVLGVRPSDSCTLSESCHPQRVHPIFQHAFTGVDSSDMEAQPSLAHPAR